MESFDIATLIKDAPDSNWYREYIELIELSEDIKELCRVVHRNQQKIMNIIQETHIEFIGEI